MLNPDLKLKWGLYPQLIFKNFNELFEALGEISNPKYCSIHFEENTLNGSRTDVFRVVFRINPEHLIPPMKAKIRSQWRFNCTEFIQYFIDNNVFDYSEKTRKLNRDFQKISNWVINQDKKYLECFNKGYFETEQTPLPPEPKIEAKNLFAINENIIEQIEARNIIKKGLPGPSSNIKSSKKIRKTDFVRKNIRDTELGLIGELYVFQSEYKKLKKAEEEGLIETVEDLLSWVSKLDDSAGYDIKSFNPISKKTIYIEVKTTSASANTPFYVSENELQFSKEHPDNYMLFRLYNLKKDSSDDIEYFELKGDLTKNSSLLITPKTYEVRIK